MYIDGQVEKLRVDSLSVCGCSSYPEANGKYERRVKVNREVHSLYNMARSNNHVGGATMYVWVKTTDDGTTSLEYHIEATDVYGSSWVLSRCNTGEQEDDGENEGETEAIETSKQVLYRWTSEAFTSLVPPPLGWSAIKGGNVVGSKDMKVSYNIYNGRHC